MNAVSLTTYNNLFDPIKNTILSLKFKYILFIGWLHLLMGYLAYQLIGTEKIWFLAVEFGILVSLFLSYLLYKQLIAPLNLIAAGAAAIEDRDFQVKMVKTGSREMDRLIGVYNTMIDHLRTERQQMQEQHYFMQQIFQRSPSAILLFDFDNRLTYVNPQAQKWFQLTDYQGIELEKILLPITKKINSLPFFTPTTYQTDGSKQYRIERSQFVDRGFNRQFVIIEDLSQEILDAEKRAYEKVIRMMAHEVNNSIGAINSIIESNIDYQREIDDPFAAEMSDALRVAKERNDRLNIFMRNFADIVRLPPPTKEWVTLNKLVQDAAQLMRPYAAQQQVQIAVVPTKADLKINLDPRQIEQVLVNVIKNAVEAIEGAGTIKITCSTEPKRVVISDNGKGISEEQAAQLFTPFYSDKPHGQGIGLTLTREILLNHGFEFSLKTVGEWTHFAIKF